jgi:hypothetical protein
MPKYKNISVLKKKKVKKTKKITVVGKKNLVNNINIKIGDKKPKDEDKKKEEEKPITFKPSFTIHNPIPQITHQPQPHPNAPRVDSGVAYKPATAFTMHEKRENATNTEKAEEKAPEASPARRTRVVREIENIEDEQPNILDLMGARTRSGRHVIPPVQFTPEDEEKIRGKSRKRS